MFYLIHLRRQWCDLSPVQVTGLATSPLGQSSSVLWKEDRQSSTAACRAWFHSQDDQSSPAQLSEQHQHLEDLLARHTQQGQSSVYLTISAIPSRRHYADALSDIMAWLRGCGKREAHDFLTTDHGLWSLCRDILLEGLCLHSLHDDGVLRTILCFLGDCCISYHAVEDLLQPLSIIHRPWMHSSVELQQPTGQVLLSKWLISRLSTTPLWKPQDPYFISDLAITVATIASIRGEHPYLTRKDVRFMLDGFLHFYNQSSANPHRYMNRYAVDSCLWNLVIWIIGRGGQPGLNPQELTMLSTRVKTELTHPWNNMEDSHQPRGYPSPVDEWQACLRDLEAEIATLTPCNPVTGPKDPRSSSIPATPSTEPSTKK